MFGLIFLLLSGDAGREFISPGPLTVHHGTVGRRCENCHTVFQGGLTKWVRADMTSGPARDDSGLCLGCHTLGDQALRPHTSSPEKLARITSKIRKRPPPAGGSPALFLASLLDLRGGQAGGAKLACAVCHKEHRGRKFDLTAMDNRRCQACHVHPYGDFGTSHPEFTRFPYGRRTRLIFDHVSHPKHFSKKGLLKKGDPLPCGRCHDRSPAAGEMLMKGFGESCAFCHEADIRAEGIPIFTLPALDLDTLRDADVDVGEWPEDAQEEEITAFMRLLLASDPGFAKVEAALDDDDDEKQVIAAGRLARLVKALLFDLSIKGQQGFRDRMVKALGRSLSEGETLGLIMQMPVQVVRKAQRSWLPKLEPEMARWKAAEKKKSDGGEEGKKDRQVKASSDEGSSAADAWRREDFSLIYRPTGHADRFVRAWLDLSVKGRKGSVLDKVFTALTEKTEFPNLCGKCHSVDEVEGVRRVNWEEKRPRRDGKGFNRFLHAPHLTLGDGKGCFTCHRPGRNTADLYKDFNPAKYNGNFKRIKKAECAACHKKAEAPEGCLTCHNYHIGEKGKGRGRLHAGTAKGIP